MSKTLIQEFQNARFALSKELQIAPKATASTQHVVGGRHQVLWTKGHTYQRPQPEPQVFVVIGTED